MKPNFLVVGMVVLFIGGVSGCKPQEKSLETLMTVITPIIQATKELVSASVEGEILEIPLPAPINSAEAEISGMDWYEDQLVLLPQYPSRFEIDGFGSLFMIEKSDIQDYINNPNGDPIQIERVKFDDGGISEQLKGFEGFESIAFHGDHFYVTVETKPGASMLGYVYRGSIDQDMNVMTIEPEVYQAIKPQAWFANASEEAILIITIWSTRFLRIMVCTRTTTLSPINSTWI